MHYQCVGGENAIAHIGGYCRNECENSAKAECSQENVAIEFEETFHFRLVQASANVYKVSHVAVVLEP